jgi:hypothetical protein
MGTRARSADALIQAVRSLRSVTAMDRYLSSPWNAPWNGALDSASAASAVSAMTCAVGAASAHGARGRASCPPQVRGVSTLGVSRFVERMLLAGLSGSAPTAVTDGGGGVDEAPKPLRARTAGQGRVRPANRAGARIADPRRARERFIARGGEALGGAQQAGLYPADRGRITRHQRGQIGKRHTRSFTSAGTSAPKKRP